MLGAVHEVKGIRSQLADARSACDLGGAASQRVVTAPYSCHNSARFKLETRRKSQPWRRRAAWVPRMSRFPKSRSVTSLAGRPAEPRPTEWSYGARMQPLTASGEAAVQNLAHRYGVSVDAAKTLLFAVNAGGGTMAQFYHSELGGGGQWMRGGMTMVGDMFNGGLQATVAGLCSELSSLLNSQQVFQPLPPAAPGMSGYGN